MSIPRVKSENSIGSKFLDVFGGISRKSHLSNNSRLKIIGRRSPSPKLSSGGGRISTITGSVQMNLPNGEEDYLITAAQFVCSAQKSEAADQPELAFNCYKQAVLRLIQGVQTETDSHRRGLARRKTAKYLAKAENIYRSQLAFDRPSTSDVGAALWTGDCSSTGSWDMIGSLEISDSGSAHLDGGSNKCGFEVMGHFSTPPLWMQEPSLLGLHGASSELKDMKVISIVTNKVFKVQKSNNEFAILKFLPRSAYPEKNYLRQTILMADEIRQTMPKLERFYLLDHSVVLLMEWVDHVLLWTIFEPWLKLRQNKLRQHISGHSLKDMRCSKTEEVVIEENAKPEVEQSSPRRPRARSALYSIHLSTGSNDDEDYWVLMGDHLREKDNLAENEGTLPTMMTNTDNYESFFDRYVRAGGASRHSLGSLDSLSLEIPTSYYESGGTTPGTGGTSPLLAGGNALSPSNNRYGVSPGRRKFSAGQLSAGGGSSQQRPIETIKEEFASSSPSSSSAGVSESNALQHNSDTQSPTGVILPAIDDNRLQPPPQFVISDYNASTLCDIRHWLNANGWRSASSPPLRFLRFWWSQLAGTLAEMQEHGLIWRDLMPQNLLIGRDGRLRLTHYSKWSLVDDVVCEEAMRKLYVAPEILLAMPAPDTVRAQWWSFGALTYELLIGWPLCWLHPHLITSHTELFDEPYMQLLIWESVEQQRECMPLVVQDLLKNCLAANAYERFDSDEILTHPFFDDEK